MCLTLLKRASNTPANVLESHGSSMYTLPMIYIEHDVQIFLLLYNFTLYRMRTYKNYVYYKLYIHREINNQIIMVIKALN